MIYYTVAKRDGQEGRLHFLNLFSERLRILREKSNTSQEHLANKIGKTRSVIADYERGHRHPPMDVLIKLADFFGVTTDYLLGRTDDPQLALPKKGVSVILSSRNTSEDIEKVLMEIFQNDQCLYNDSFNRLLSRIQEKNQKETGHPLTKEEVDVLKAAFYQNPFIWTPRPSRPVLCRPKKKRYKIKIGQWTDTDWANVQKLIDIILRMDPNMWSVILIGMAACAPRFAAEYDLVLTTTSSYSKELNDALQQAADKPVNLFILRPGGGMSYKMAQDILNGQLVYGSSKSINEAERILKEAETKEK